MAIAAIKRRLAQLVAGVSWRARFCKVMVHAWLKMHLLGRVRFVAITGSAGKTTTKELCAGVLSCKGSVSKTQHTSNDPLQVAETLLSIRRHDQYAVLEVAGAEPGMMDWPLRLFRPDIAVVTIIQREHVRSGYGIEDVATEKFRLVNALKKKGTAILNIDDPLLRKRGEQSDKHIFWIGRDEGATLRLLECRSQWPQALTLTVRYQGRDYTVQTRLYGEHLAVPVLSTLAVALTTGMTMAEAIDALQLEEPAEGRMHTVTGRDNVVFLRDDWKAPLWSLDAPLAFMRDAKAVRKVIVLGTLSDYSRSASKLYPQVAAKALEMADQVIFVGPHAQRATKRAIKEDHQRLRGFTDTRQASVYLQEILEPGDLVLLKGTNRVDHLVRLMLDREKPVACWESRCGKTIFCTQCPRLYDFESAPPPIPMEPAVGPGTQPLINAALETTILVGLGNPGESYHLTRHNAGSIVLDYLAEQQRLRWETVPNGHIAEGSLNGRRVMLLKPDTVINRSGEVLQQLLGEEVLARSAIIIYDDMDLALGVVRVRRSGGDGGHLGIRSIIAAFQTQNFQRLKLGVRPAGEDRKSSQLVHQKLTHEEIEKLTSAFSQSLPQLLGHAQHRETS